MRLIRWLVARALPAWEREFVIGDLEEEFARRGGALGARAWLWRQAIALLAGCAARGISSSIQLLGRDGMLQDIRYAIRVLAKDRAFTIAVLLTLALCIGGNTLMFSVVRSVILKPLPFPEPDRLVKFYNNYPKQGSTRASSSVPNYFDRRGTLPALEDIAVYQRDQVRLGSDAGVERIASLRATPSLLQLLGTKPLYGRLFVEGDGQLGRDTVVLLTYEFWQRRFGGAPMVNQQIRLQEVPFVVVGILPPGFSFLTNDMEVVTPLAFTAARRAENQRYSGGYQMVGRLRTGATIAEAEAQVNALNASLVDRTPEMKQRVLDAGFFTSIVPLHEDTVGGAGVILYPLWAAVGIVLVIGCVNVANLVTVRARGRTQELATRHAIGAGFGQLSRQLLTETLVLALAGGAFGILLGAWALRSLDAVVPIDQMRRGFEIGLDWVGVLVMASITALAGLVVGVMPVLRLRRMNLNVELRAETRSGTSGRAALLMRNALATLQFTLAFVLLAGAGLLFASFHAATRVDLGFEPANAYTVTVELPAHYRNPAAQSQYVQRAVAALQSLPEVDAAGATTFVPYAGWLDGGRFVAEGSSTIIPAAIATATPGYFRALGVRVVAGRDFETRDGEVQPEWPVVIDQRLARLLWPGQNAVGRRMYPPRDTNNPSAITESTQFRTVIGVVNEMRVRGPQNDENMPGMVFHPYDHRPNTTIHFVVKARTDADLRAQIRAVMADHDPTVPTYQARSMEEWIDRALADRRVPMIFAVIFASVSLLLCAVGVYGVIAHGVAQRRREIGVRMALGETTSGVFRLVLANGVWIVGVGLAAGVVGAYVVGQLMEALLYSVAPTSPLVLTAVGATLSAAALIATVVPAWRASRIDPVTVLGR